MAYLSYSGFKAYTQCPLGYYHSYIGKTPPALPDDRLGSIFGSTIGLLFQAFYDDKLWQRKDCTAYMQSQALPTLDKVLRSETSKGGVLLWKGLGKGKNPKGLYEDRSDILNDLQDCIPRGISTIRHERLIGSRVGTEVDLTVTSGPHKVGGRADFIFRRVSPDADLLILDGKGSRSGGRFMDPRQLYWYAMLHRAKFGVVPDKLAFVYWKLTPPNSVDWVNFSESDLDVLWESVLDAMSEIDSRSSRVRSVVDKVTRLAVAQETFRSSPSKESCKFCKYASKALCPKPYVAV